MEIKYTFRVKESLLLNLLLAVVTLLFLYWSIKILLSDLEGRSWASILILCIAVITAAKLYYNLYGYEEITLKEGEISIIKHNFLFPGNIKNMTYPYSEFESAHFSIIGSPDWRTLPYKISLQYKDPLFRQECNFASGADDETANEIAAIINDRIEEAKRDSSLRSE